MPPEDGGASPRPDPERQVQTTCLLILTIIAAGGALHLLRPVFVPFLLALFFVYCLTPVIDWQMRRIGLSRGAAIGSAVLLSTGFLGLLAVLVTTSLGKLGYRLEQYEGNFGAALEQTVGGETLENLGVERDPVTKEFVLFPPEASKRVLSVLLTTLSSFIQGTTLVIIFMLFIWFGGKGVPVPPGGLLSEIELRVRRYVLQLVIFSILTGVLVGLALAVLGVEFALVFGFLAFLLNFIPNIGSIIATLVPLPVILVSPDMSLTAKALAVLIPATIQFTLGNVIMPRVMSEDQNLHAVVTMMALIFFGTIWGIVGAVLAVPITGVAKIVLDRIPATRPVGALLAGDLSVLLGSSGPEKGPS